ncbi:MAG: minor capsid protein, partial [Ignavibacteria bacterium]|nr:minor capsid protein [Ignavibacteria bacterium]
VNKELCPLFGDNLYLDFEDVVPEDSVAAVTRAVELFKNKLITRNEGRALVNMEALEDEQGDEFFTGDAAGLLSFAPVASKLLPGGNGGSEHPKGLFSDDGAKEEYWKGYVRRVEAYENLIITSLNELFDKQSIEAVANLDHATSPQYRLVDNQKFKDGFVKSLTPTLVTLLQDSIEHGMDLVAPKAPPRKEGPIPVVINQLALTWLETRIGWAADEVGEETAKLLGRTLTEGFKLGESTDDIAKRVRGLFSDMTKVRSKRIARTETISASNFGAQEGYKEAGVKQTEWYTAIDERVCDICEPLHGKVSAISEGEVPPAHPNCRCTILPVIPPLARS